MAYVAYRTWTTGEIVTAALMNEQVRDNGLLTAPAIMTTAGDIMYASAANTPARLAKSTSSTRVLTNTGTSNVPAWAQVTLTSGVTGTLPVANGGTNLTSLGSGVATFMGTPSSANLRGALTDETGTGAAVFGTSPTLVTPALGTPASGVLTNATGLPVGGLANGTDGQLITWGTDAVATTVAVGTSTHVLTSNGAGAAPTFQAAGGGGLILLGTIEADDSAITLTLAGLSSTYESFLVEIANIHVTTDDESLAFRVGDSSGIDEGGSDYDYHTENKKVASAAYAAAVATDNYIKLAVTGVGNATGEGFSAMLWVQADSVTFPQVHGTMAYQDTSGDLVGGVVIGQRNAAISITQIRLVAQSNIVTGRVTVWGLKHV